MADTKSKAQELAGALEAMRGPFLGDGIRTVRADEIAAELRRLDAVEAERGALKLANEAFSRRQEWWDNRMVEIEAERDALRSELDRARQSPR